LGGGGAGKGEGAGNDGGAQPCDGGERWACSDARALGAWQDVWAEQVPVAHKEL